MQTIKQLVNFHDFEFWASPMWGSNQPDSRELLQKELNEATKNGYASTISHTHEIGGFIVYANTVQMGLDIEEVARIKDNVVRRVCTSDEEFKQAPSAPSLWAAKEACFKSLKGPHQPTALSEIILTNWKTVRSGLETFEQKNPKGFRSVTGVVIYKYDYVYGICVAHALA